MFQLNQAYTLVCPEHGNKITLKTTYLFLLSFVIDMNINFLERYNILKKLFWIILKRYIET